MELINGTPSKASKFATEDHNVVTSMPENVVTNILDRLPIRDAVGTGILSRAWRFKWTMLTQLVFDYEDYLYDEGDLSRLLLQLKGPITKFVLCIPDDKVLDVKHIYHWVMFLSRKGIKEFTLINKHETPVRLPTHIFSCLELKHLKLCNCCFSLTPTFFGFPNLLSLDLFRVTFESGNCGQLITQCPLLEILKVSYHHDPSGKLKLVEIAKLKNLIVLSLSLCKLDYTLSKSSIVCQLGSRFPRLQELNLDFQNCKFQRELNLNEYIICNAFPSLKTLTLSHLNFDSDTEVLTASGMIWSSPNLRTLSMTATYPYPFLPSVFCSTDSDRIVKLEQLQLQDVVFRSCRGSRIEVYLIGHLLACSPLLNKMVIHSHSLLSSDGKLMFATTLLKLSRASHTAKVDFY